MGCGNPPVLTAIEEGQDEHSLTTIQTHSANSFGADIMPFPFISLGYAHFPRHDIQGDCRSYPPECENENNRLCGYMDLNCLTDSQTDADLINVKRDMSEFHREPEMSYPDVSMRELYHAIDRNNTVSADCSMNTAVSSTDCRKSEVHMNFMPLRCETATGYPIKAHGAEAKNIISRSQMSGKFSSSECSTSVLPLVDNFGVTGNKNDINLVPLPFSAPQKVDRNFLTLGIGGGTEIRSNSNFSTREIASKLEDAVSSQCNSSLFGRIPKNPSSLTQLTGSAARIQTNAGGLSNSACNLAGKMPTRDEGGLDGDTSSRLNSNLLPCLHTPQTNAQSSFSAKYDTFIFDLTPSSLPFGSTLISQPECVTPTPLGPKITPSTYFASQSIPRQHDYCRKSSMNASSESSRNYLSDRHRGSSISHAQLGKLIPLTEDRRTQSSAGVHFPGSVQPVGNLTSLAEGTSTESAKIGSFPSSVQPVGLLDTLHNVGSVEAPGNSLFPERIGFQISKGSTFQSAAAGPFPKRLGVQPNDFATARTTKGPSPIHLAAQVNPFRPSVFSGQHKHGMATQLSKDFPRVDYSNGQVIPVAKLDVRPQPSPIVSHPYLKRQATENSPTARLGQRRKIFPQSVVHHSTPRQRQSIPATPSPIPATVHIPPAPLHVKWQDFDAPLEPTGQKCLLCKRDLSFTAEGPVYQPAIPPSVAVLPCGHIFHDHCLQIITPEDLSKSPPCIPCAIGET